MQLPSRERPVFGVDIGNREKVRAFQFERFPRAVVRVCPQRDFVVNAPFYECERPVADHVLGARPAGVAPVGCAEFFERFAREREERAVVEH